MSNTPSIKVLSYNIHKGFSIGNLKFVLDRIKAVIRSVHADVVLLQEVIGQNVKHAKRYAQWPSEPQFEYLADSTWTHFAYGKNAIYRYGHHGNAILIKFPIVHSDNFDISQNRFEQRGLLHAEIEHPGSEHPVHCYSLHLNLMQRHRKRQLDELVATVHKQAPGHEPLILGGDFNDWSGRASSTLASVLHLNEAFQSLHGRYAKTYPATLPILSLDRVYTRGFQALSAQVVSGPLWSFLSDHVALSVELQFVRSG